MGEYLDNISQQTEEMEAMSSIYGNQWKVDERTGIFSIDITKSVRLDITLVPEYPSKSLPKYELLAPELSSKQKQMIAEEFKNIFINGDGGPLIYQMILAVEEIASQNTNNIEQKSATLNESESMMNIIMETSDLVLTKTLDLNIVHGPIIEDRKSVFQGHVCKVCSKDDVTNFTQNLLENRKIAHATHNISAYRIVLSNNVVLQDCDDDGENRASGRLLELLQNLKLNNVMVVVSRWYGGVHLGPDRFRHINNAARQALIAGGYIQS